MIMEKKEAMKILKDFRDKSALFSIRTALDTIIPELQESEDEKIRKECISIIKAWDTSCRLQGDYCEVAPKCIAWLEKQDEPKPQGKSALEAIKEEKVNNQNCVKPADEVEPKFHKNDWIIHQGTDNIYQVVACINNQYQLKYGDNYTLQKFTDVDRCARLWTIKDAKDGDILSSGQIILLFKEWECSDCNFVIAYAGIDVSGKLQITDKHWLISNCALPATKEQRDALTKAMTDAGYTFDFEKKELKKIEDEIKIPFGAKDSELQEVTYYIPKGFHAEIDDDKVVLKKGEKPTAWSEKDEKQVRQIERIVHDDGCTQKLQKQIADWLKSLKDRVQPKQEWSEEDLYMLEQAIKCVNNSEKLEVSTEEIEDWLKSLKNV